LALLWATGAWREELRQLLLLLAERAVHRLHPLPWALPVPPGSTAKARGSRVLLFVREQRKQDGHASGPTEPFLCLGFASYEGHEGERPMAIRWRLERQIPAAWLPGCCLA